MTGAPKRHMLMMTPTQSSPGTPRSFWSGTLWISILVAFACNGCLSKPALKHDAYAFQNPPPSKTVTAADGGVIACSVAVSPLFNRHQFVYRIGPEAYETDPYAGFLVAPGQAVAIATRAHLLSSGRFQNVVEPGSRVKADKSIEVHVSELYGDFSESSQPAAVLSMRIILFDGEDTKRRPPLLQQNYSRRVPLRGKTAAAVMAGWNTALAEIMAEAAPTLASGKGL